MKLPQYGQNRRQTKRKYHELSRSGIYVQTVVRRRINHVETFSRRRYVHPAGGIDCLYGQSVVGSTAISLGKSSGHAKSPYYPSASAWHGGLSHSMAWPVRHADSKQIGFAFSFHRLSHCEPIAIRRIRHGGRYRHII